MSVIQIVDDLFEAAEKIDTDPRNLSEQDKIDAMKKAVVSAVQDAIDEAVDAAVDLALAKARRQHAHW